LRLKAQERVTELHQRGMNDATLYDASNTSVGGTHAMFIVRGDPRSYNLPPKPEVPTIYLKKAWTSSAIGAALLLGGTLLAFLADGER
jgi:formate dehydrogenase iron-sulfur subunit